MDKGGINDVDDKTFSQEIADLVGTYASPDGDTDMITISVKVNRDLHNRYDVMRRLYKRTRREDVETFMRWSIERYKSESKGLETFFIQDKDT